MIWSSDSSAWTMSLMSGSATAPMLKICVEPMVNGQYCVARSSRSVALSVGVGIVDTPSSTYGTNLFSFINSPKSGILQPRHRPKPACTSSTWNCKAKYQAPVRETSTLFTITCRQTNKYRYVESNVCLFDIKDGNKT